MVAMNQFNGAYLYSVAEVTGGIGLRFQRENTNGRLHWT